MKKEDTHLTRDLAPFGLRMQPDLKARIQAVAEANNRSMNAEIVATLEDKYPAPVPADGSAEWDVLNEYLDLVESAMDGSEREAVLTSVNARLRDNPALSRFEITVTYDPFHQETFSVAVARTGKK